MHVPNHNVMRGVGLDVGACLECMLVPKHGDKQSNSQDLTLILKSTCLLAVVT